MNIKSIIVSILAGFSSLALSSCGASYYNRSASKGGMSESGGSQFFNPLAGLVEVQIISGNSGYRSGGYCPPRYPSGGYYGRPSCPPPSYGGGYRRPPCNGGGYQPRPPQYGGGYPQRPPQPPYLGSAARPIEMYGAAFSDFNPGGSPEFDPRRRRR